MANQKDALTNEARLARNAYHRKWCKEHPDKVRAIRKAYWERKAYWDRETKVREQAEEDVNGGAKNE